MAGLVRLGVAETDRYRDAIRYLYSLQKYGIKFGLSKTTNLLRAFENPHLDQNYIHIGGTNGKGSVAAFMANVLQRAGYKVGLYTSPHLVSFRERFKINGVPISKRDVAQLVEEIKGAVVESEPPTFFEFTTAMALVYFERQKTDVAIMEVGMGGRLDATNVITPLVSIITNIGMEHQFFLGNTLLEIAREKAGIIKPGVPVITGARQKKVVEYLKDVSSKRRALFLRIGRDFKYRVTQKGFYFMGERWALGPLNLGLLGRFQGRNAALALGSLEILDKEGLGVSVEAIEQGLRDTSWPGRLHLLSENPFLVLDGAHNPAAMKTMVDSIREQFRYQRLIAVLGVMEDKDIGAMVRQIAPIASHMIYTRPAYSRAAAPEILYEKGMNLHASGEIITPLDEAIKRAKAMAQKEDLILICGSLFTVGEALTILDPKRYPSEGL